MSGRLKSLAALLLALVPCLPGLAQAAGFEGKIEIVVREEGETTSLLYRAAGDFLRIEISGSTAPNPIDLVDLKSGTLTMLFPQNQSFTRCQPARSAGSEKIELQPTGKNEKILGYDCAEYEIKTRGESMAIWATSELFSFWPYQRNQPEHLGPRMLTEQWPDLLAAKKLFPLRAVGKSDGGAENYRAEVKSITPEKAREDKGKLFEPPADYTEIQALAFPGR